MAEKEIKVENPVQFTKEQLLQRFPGSPDVVAVVLDDEKTYTIDQAEKLVNSFLKVRDK